MNVVYTSPRTINHRLVVVIGLILGLVAILTTGCYRVRWANQTFTPERGGVLTYNSGAVGAAKRATQARQMADEFCAPGVAKVISIETRSVYAGSHNSSSAYSTGYSAFGYGGSTPVYHPWEDLKFRCE